MSCSIEAKNLAYINGNGTLFENITFSLTHKERVCIVGGNGIGKSTILKILGGLKNPSSGEIYLFHHKMEGLGDFKKYRREIGFLFQDSDDQFLAPTVLEDVAFGLLNSGLSKDEARRRALDILERFGIAHLADAFPLKLSGGEKKLVALAGVLVCEPKILLLDEPSNGLDEKSVKRVTDILASLDATTIIASHDMGFADALGVKKMTLSKDGLLTLS